MDSIAAQVPDSIAADQTHIVFDNVAKNFGPLRAVENVNLSVRRGDVVTLVGPSGCGKSTLLNMTAGLFQPTEGHVRYDGAEVTTLNRRTGYMTQNDHLLPWRTVADNIAVPLEIAGLSQRAIADRVGGLIGLVGLKGFETSYPARLSGGMRKRTALARLLAYDPETLLLDEPFAALDAQLRLAMQVELLSISRRLGKQSSSSRMISMKLSRSAIPSRCFRRDPAPSRKSFSRPCHAIAIWRGFGMIPAMSISPRNYGTWSFRRIDRRCPLRP